MLYKIGEVTLNYNSPNKDEFIKAMNSFNFQLCVIEDELAYIKYAIMEDKKEFEDVVDFTVR